MDQYCPAWRVTERERLADINRRVTSDEFAEAVRHALEAGLWRLDARWR